VKRTWKAGDTLHLRLPMALRVRPAQDDPATLSFFHGPVLPIPPDPATPLLLDAQMFDPDHEQEVRVIILPFYRIHYQRYAVY